LRLSIIIAKKNLKRTRLFFAAAIAWLIISIVLLTLPGTAFPTEDWLDKIWFDKWVHIGMFGIMVLLWCLSWKSLKQNADRQSLVNAFWTIAAIFLAYGIGMEFIQKYFIPFRSFDVTDIAADAVGSALGAFFSIRKYIKK